MDSYILDENIADGMQDLERSLVATQVSHESLQRSLDVYEGLTSLLSAQDNLSTESFTRVMTPSYKLAFAGVGIDVDKLSTESLVETIKIMGKAVLDAIKRFFSSMMDFFSQLDVMATWMTQQCNYLERKRLSSLGKVAKKPMVEMGRNHRHLRIGRIFPESIMKLTASLKEYNSLLDVINKHYTPALVTAGGKFTSVSGDRHDVDLTNDLIKIIDGIGFNALARQCKMNGIDKSRFGRDNVSSTPPLIGGMSLYYMQADLVNKGVRGLRFHGFIFESTSREPYKIEDKYEFKALTPADMNGLPEIIRGLLTQVSKGSSDNAQKHMKKLRSDLERYVSARMSDDKTTEADFSQIRSVSNALTSWSRIPAPMYGNILSVIRATLSYAQLSVKNWG